ncbi:hypothetical protein KA005_18575, partial [bacterium]|nr:hypothetical protein [bacterium]
MKINIAAVIIIIMFKLTVYALDEQGTGLQREPEPENKKNFSTGAYLLYGWFFQELTVGVGDLSAKYIERVAQFKKDKLDGGIGGFIELYGNRLSATYTGTGELDFKDIDYRALSLTLDAKLFRLFSFRKVGEDGTMVMDHELHIHYKQNTVEAEKYYGNFSTYRNATKDYYSNWYNVALLYYIHIYIIPPKKDNSMLGFLWWAGISTGNFEYRTGIDWTDSSNIR